MPHIFRPGMMQVCMFSRFSFLLFFLHNFFFFIHSRSFHSFPVKKYLAYFFFSRECVRFIITAAFRYIFLFFSFFLSFSFFSSACVSFFLLSFLWGVTYFFRLFSFVDFFFGTFLSF